MDRAELAAWLRLLEAPGLGRGGVRRLLAALGTPEGVLDASPAALTRAGGPGAAAALAEVPEGFDARLSATERWLQDDGVPREVVTLGDTRYPPNLLQTADPPLLLFVQGRIELLVAPQIAIVGSRNPTAQGADNARAFATHLAGAGWTITSGLALGVDGAAHEAALDAGGTTVAIIGTGPDIVYPRRHLALAHRIAGQGGLIVSEFPLGTPSIGSNFPQRNRLIAGLSQGTLVVEAALRSGSLITARMAAEAGREVFAIPGSIHSPQSRGCHALIKQGAKLVESGQDVLEELQAPGALGPHPGMPAVEPAEGTLDQADDALAVPGDPVLAALGQDPIGLDLLSARTGWSNQELSARLLELELEGLVARLPGQRFQRRYAG